MTNNAPYVLCYNFYDSSSIRRAVSDLSKRLQDAVDQEPDLKHTPSQCVIAAAEVIHDVSHKISPAGPNPEEVLVMLQTGHRQPVLTDYLARCYKNVHVCLEKSVVLVRVNAYIVGDAVYVDERDVFA